MDPLAEGTKSITVCHENKSINQIAAKHCTVLQAVSGYCWTGTEGGNVMCGKCGAVERDLSGGCNDGLSCLWKDLEMELLEILSLDFDISITTDHILCTVQIVEREL